MEFELRPHIAIQVRKQREAIQFYRDVLGMEVRRRGARESELVCGPITFHVEDAETNHTYFDFAVVDLDEAKARLIEAGCTLRETVTPEGSRSYLVRDPYGLRFHLWQR